MSDVAFLPGIVQRRVRTNRLEIAYLEAGEGNEIPVVLVHGNVSCSWFFEDLMLALAGTGLYHVFAPDLRGYGDTETLPVDATRGVKDHAEDLESFVQALQLAPFHLLGWSMGGNVIMEYAVQPSGKLRSLVLEDTSSPFGFGGTKGVNGEPNYPDFAGSGGGTANPDFAERLKNKDRSSDSPNSPRSVMNGFYFKPPFQAPPEREEIYVSAMLTTVVGEGNYPGDLTQSENWPSVAPGTRGVNNSFSPKYLNQAYFADINPKPEVLWMRGDSDLIVSDNSFLDFGTLGQLGYVPGWPGEEVFPPQPMVSQIRGVLDKYKANGGVYNEVVLPECGHAPHVEKFDEVCQLLVDFFGAH